MKFARKVWKLLVAVKDGLVLLLLLLFFGLIYIGLSARPVSSRVEDGALLLKLDGSIVEEKSQADPLAMLLSTGAPVREFQARDVARALRLAAHDKRIKVVVLDLSRFTGGRYVHLHDIGVEMDKVRKAGKPVLAFANAYADNGVQLAAHASEVWVDTMGGAFITGPGGNTQFYKGLLDRFHITAHIFRVGTHKSAVEPYMRSDFSDEARADLKGVYDVQWQAYRHEVLAARPKAQLEQMIAEPAQWLKASGGNTAQAAKAAGLVDRIGDKTEFEKRVLELAGKSAIARDESDTAPAYAHTSLATWLAANPVKTEGAKIAVVTIAGEIVDGEAGPGKAGGDRIARLLDDHLDKKYKALVVRVDSPGGSVMASERIRKAIVRWKEAKIPVVVSMGSMAASGGYWVSTPGQRVFAEPATITGSIGVFAVLPTFEKTLADFGVTSDGVRTTPMSGQPDILGGLSPAASDMIQTSVEGIYSNFLSLVGKARGKSAQDVDAIAQGRVWSGATAQRLGLVDEIGDLDTALAYAAKLANIGNGPWHSVFITKKPDSLSTFLEGLASGSQDDMAVYDFASLMAMRQQMEMTRALQGVQALMGTRGAQALCLECSVEPDYQDWQGLRTQLPIWTQISNLIR